MGSLVRPEPAEKPRIQGTGSSGVCWGLTSLYKSCVFLPRMLFSISLLTVYSTIASATHLDLYLYFIYHKHHCSVLQWVAHACWQHIIWLRTLRSSHSWSFAPKHDALSGSNSLLLLPVKKGSSMGTSPSQPAANTDASNSSLFCATALSVCKGTLQYSMGPACPWQASCRRHSLLLLLPSASHLWVFCWLDLLRFCV